MFERYTEEARRAVFFACYESFLHDAKEITPVFLLLGLSREFGSLTEVLRARGEDATKLREILGLAPPPPKSHSKLKIPPTPLSPNSKIALARAAMEAESDHSIRIHPDHLLRALMCFENEATPALSQIGLELESLRESSRQRKPWSSQDIKARLSFFLWRFRNGTGRLILRSLVGVLSLVLVLVLAEIVLAIMNGRF